MLNRKPINILVTYIKKPNINGFRSLVEQAIKEVDSDEIDLVECHISDVQDVAQTRRRLSRPCDRKGDRDLVGL